MAMALAEMNYMTDKRVTLDINILIYAIDKDAGEKQEIAINLIEECVLERDCVLTIQSLSEFYYASTRKGMVSHEDAEAQIFDWQLLFPTILPSSHTVAKALKVVADHTISFWDAMLWSVANENRVDELYSEDFQAGRALQGVTFVNPFIHRTT
jgi:predicted nucleic acid-binding protein